MTTLDDQATEHEEKSREIALQYRKPVPAKTGLCLECFEPAKGAYCCKECRETHEQRQRFRR